MHVCDRWVDLKNTVLLSQEIIFAQLAGEQMKPILVPIPSASSKMF